MAVAVARRAEWTTAAAKTYRCLHESPRGSSSVNPPPQPRRTQAAASQHRCNQFSDASLILRRFFPNCGEKRACRIKGLHPISQLIEGTMIDVIDAEATDQLKAARLQRSKARSAVRAFVRPMALIRGEINKTRSQEQASGSSLHTNPV